MTSVACRQIVGHGDDTWRNISSKVSLALFISYPIFGRLFGDSDYPWCLAMAAGVLLIIQNFSLNIRITLSTVAWITITAVALISFLALGSSATYNPKRVITFVMTIALMIVLSTKRGWIAPAMKIALVMLSVHAIATMLFLLLPGLYDSLVKPIFFPNIASAVGYQSGLTSHYSYNGMLLSAGVLLSTADFVSARRFSRKGQTSPDRKIVLVLLFCLALVATSKRGPLIAVVTATLLTAYICSGKYKAVALLKIAFVVVLVATAFCIAVQFIPQLGNVVLRLQEIGSADASDADSGRSLLWDRAIELFQSNPVFGHGWGTYRYYWSGRSDLVTVTAHNVVLNLLAEVGIVGLLIFFVAATPALLGLWRMASRIGKLDSHWYMPIYFAFSFQLFFFVYSFTGSPLYDMESYSFYLLMSCGVWMVLGDGLRKRSSRSFWWAVRARTASSKNPERRLGLPFCGHAVMDHGGCAYVPEREDADGARRASGGARRGLRGLRDLVRGGRGGSRRAPRRGGEGVVQSRDPLPGVRRPRHLRAHRASPRHLAVPHLRPLHRAED